MKSIIDDAINEDMCSDNLFNVNDTKPKSESSIIFKDTMVIINIFHQNMTVKDVCCNEPKITVNVPFNSSRFERVILISKIKKILKISCSGYCDIVNGDVHKWLRLDNNIQLTISESKIVELTEQGNDITDISKKLDRSEKTILNHRRRAIIKLGGLNRLDFYNYVSKMENHSNKQTVFICI